MNKMKSLAALLVCFTAFGSSDSRLPSKTNKVSPAVGTDMFTLNRKGNNSSTSGRYKDNLMLLWNGSTMKLDVGDQGAKLPNGGKCSVSSIVSGSDVKCDTKEVRMYATTTCVSNCTAQNPKFKTECWVDQANGSTVTCEAAFPNANWSLYSYFKSGYQTGASCTDSVATNLLTYNVTSGQPTTYGTQTLTLPARGTYCYATVPAYAGTLDPIAGVVKLSEVIDASSAYSAVTVTY